MTVINILRVSGGGYADVDKRGEGGGCQLMWIFYILYYKISEWR